MDEVENKIFRAISSRRFRARTLQGIANEAKLNTRLVAETLKRSQFLNDKVKIYPRKSKDGRILITTKDNFSKNASLKDKFIDAFATKRMRLEDEY